MSRSHCMQRKSVAVGCLAAGRASLLSGSHGLCPASHSRPRYPRRHARTFCSRARGNVWQTACSQAAHGRSVSHRQKALYTTRQFSICMHTCPACHPRQPATGLTTTQSVADRHPCPPQPVTYPEILGPGPGPGTAPSEEAFV